MRGDLEELRKKLEPFECTPAYIGIMHQQFIPPLGWVGKEAEGGRGPRKFALT
jgi:hypothetical protein